MLSMSSSLRVVAKPPAIRTLLLQRFLSLPLPSTTTAASIQNRRAYSSSPSPVRQATEPRILPPPPHPPLPTLSYLPPPSNDPHQRALPAPHPARSSLHAATRLVVGPPRPQFLYSSPRFLNIPRNVRVPEVAILGRSNVGKSTLINALAGLAGAAAGRAHGTTAVRAGLAVTSARAGSTKTMNAYGIGPPTPRRPDEAPAEGGGHGQGQGRKTGLVSRRERRDGRRKKFEDAPPHSLVLMDMPGYGLNSRDEWGVEIRKYLEKRTMLRGAVLLIDAVAGVKTADCAVLRMLRDAGVRTCVVLTKADKLGYGSLADANQGVAAVESLCVRIWETLRKTEKLASSAWAEGNGWEREIWVTGAGDPKSGGVGVDGARMAICKMAGLVEDQRKMVESAPRQPSESKIISFDQLEMLQAPAASRRARAMF